MFRKIKEKNNKKIADLGGRVNDRIGKAIKGKPKLIVPFNRPPTEIASNIMKIVFNSRFRYIYSFLIYKYLYIILFN